MELSELGYDEWFHERGEESRRPGDRVARVTAVDRDWYLVRNEISEVPAELAGKARFSASSEVDLPCVGDWVWVRYLDTGASAVIHGVFPRKTVLRRKCAGKNVDFQMIAANLDVAFIVQSCHFDFNLRRLERYLVMVNEGGVEPVLLLTKIDLVGREEMEDDIKGIRQAGIGIGIIALSNTTGEGFDDLRRSLAPGRTYCLIGSSGVGKTTLINRLLGRDAFGTKAVSGTGEGTHATARRQLVLLDGGAMLVDTPGMRELGLLDAGEGIAGAFPDIRDLAGSCRFADCTHTREPGCGVLAAVESGELNPERHQSYLKLKKESEYHEMSYVERRRKDRAFGRFVKTALRPKGK